MISRCYNLEAFTRFNSLEHPHPRGTFLWRSSPDVITLWKTSRSKGNQDGRRWWTYCRFWYPSACSLRLEGDIGVYHLETRVNVFSPSAARINGKSHMMWTCHYVSPHLNCKMRGNGCTLWSRLDHRFYHRRFSTKFLKGVEVLWRWWSNISKWKVCNYYQLLHYNGQHLTLCASFFLFILQ